MELKATYRLLASQHTKTKIINMVNSTLYEKLPGLNADVTSKHHCEQALPHTATLHDW